MPVQGNDHGRCARKVLRPRCDSCCYTTKPPNRSQCFHRACVTFCLSHIWLCHFVTTLARLHTILFSAHMQHTDRSPSSHGNEASMRRVLVEIIVISGCFNSWYFWTEWYISEKKTLSHVHNLLKLPVVFPRQTLNLLPYGAQWSSDSHSWRYLNKHRKRASRVTFVMENSTTYLCCPAKKSTLNGPEGHLTAC